MLNFLNQNSGAFLALFSLIVTGATVFYAILTRRLVTETRKMREAQTEPNIFIGLKSKEEYISLADLVVQNIGLGTAYNLKFDVNPDFEYYKGHKFSDIEIIKNGLNYLAPNNKITYFLTSLIGRIKELGKVSVEVGVKYENCLGKIYQQKFLLDFSELFGLRTIGEPPLQKVAKELEKIQKDIHTIMFSSYPRIKVVAYTKKDMEEERKRQLEQINQIQKAHEK